MADSFVSRFGCYTIIRDTTQTVLRSVLRTCCVGQRNTPTHPKGVGVAFAVSLLRSRRFLA